MGFDAARQDEGPSSPSIEDYRSGLRRIALELEKLGIAAGLPGVEPRVSLSELASLTGRELEIANRFREGCAIQEIAKLSYISVHTVRNHLKSIRAKLGVHSQLELLHKLGPAGERG